MLIREISPASRRAIAFALQEHAGILILAGALTGER
jgi:hypothetical protein